MIFAALAFLAGLLIGVSRQINGRLALSTTPLRASVWNHAVGFGLLAVLALFSGALWLVPGGPPLWAYLGGPMGVVFVASSSWLVARIGAVQTALLIIGGQMIFGLVLDIALGAPGETGARILGVLLLLAGMAPSVGRRD